MDPKKQLEKEFDSDLLLEDKDQLKEPRRYAVLLYNDDYTTMEFVVEVLRKFFKKTEEQAYEVMFEVHQKGRGIAGIYSLEIAETKVAQVHSYAKRNGFPLLCGLEEFHSR